MYENDKLQHRLLLKEFFVILHIITVYKVVHLQNSDEVVNLTTVLCRNDF